MSRVIVYLVLWNHSVVVISHFVTRLCYSIVNVNCRHLSQSDSEMSVTNTVRHHCNDVTVTTG